MLPPDLASALNIAADCLSGLVKLTDRGVLGAYRWLWDGAAEIDAGIYWQRGDLKTGALRDYRASLGRRERQHKLGAAAVAAMAHGHASGAIVAGRAFSLWSLWQNWDQTSAPLFGLVLMQLEAPAFLVELARPAVTRPDLLRLSGARLRRGEALPVHGPALDEMSAHQRLRHASLVGDAMAEAGMHASAPREAAFADLVRFTSSDHVIWRAPAPNPDAVLLVDTCRSLAEARNGETRRNFVPVAISPI